MPWALKNKINYLKGHSESICLPHKGYVRKLGMNTCPRYSQTHNIMRTGAG